ncbi:MAG: hypothetical protein JSV82_01795, partial [Planctomycetota bacterium]
VAEIFGLVLRFVFREDFAFFSLFFLAFAIVFQPVNFSNANLNRPAELSFLVATHRENSSQAYVIRVLYRGSRKTNYAMR